MKLRQKIILTHVLTIALILTGVVVYGNTVLRPRLLQDKTAEYDAYINQLCTSASLVLSNMEQNCFNLYQNVLLAEGLESHASPSKKRIQVEQELRNMCGNNSYFTSFLAVDLEGNTFFGTSAITDRATPLLSAYYSLQDALENSYNYWFRGDNEEQLYLKMPVCYITPLKFTGMLIAQTSSQQMMSALGMDRAMSGKTCILTRAGASLLETSPFSTEEQQAVAEYASQTARPLSREVRIDGVSYWITVHTDTRYGWRAAHLIPLSDALNLANAVCSSGALLCLAVAALAIGLAALIAHSLTRSVQKLQLAMNEVSKGDFDVQVDINTRDEIGELAEKFSWMQKPEGKYRSDDPPRGGAPEGGIRPTGFQVPFATIKNQPTLHLQHFGVYKRAGPDGPPEGGLHPGRAGQPVSAGQSVRRRAALHQPAHRASLCGGIRISLPRDLRG